MKYSLLTDSIKNWGDFLIKYRAKQWIKAFHPDIELIGYRSWEPISKHLKAINRSKALILCGGPAIFPNIYPGVIPLTKNLDKITVPIFLLGVGWYGLPFGDATDHKQFKFTTASIRFLHKVHSNGQPSSCRDYLTQEIFERNGFPALMTGGPAWYNPDYQNKPFKPPRIKTLAFSFPEKVQWYRQAIDIVKMLKELLPGVRIICTFHRGHDKKHASSRRAAGLKTSYKTLVKILGSENVVDLAYYLDKGLELYQNCQLHIGYRVHGHISFLSQQKPSFLLEVDGRGRGFSESVMPGIWAGLSRKDKRPAQNALIELKALLQKNLEDNFAQFSKLHKVFQEHHKTMKRFMESLP